VKSGAKGVTTMEYNDVSQDKVHHHDWLIKKIEDRISKLMSGDVESSIPIPPKKALEISHIISPPEKTKEILAKSKIIANVDCVCRKNSNNPCSAPIDVCLIIDPEIAKDAIKEGKGTNVTVREAMKILDRTTEIGLVHMLLHFRGHAYHAICSCCSCCCHDLVALLKYDHKIVEKSEYIANSDVENCTSCGFCIQYCHFKAWELINNNQVSFNKERCYGCGVCVVHCPVGAINLVMR
jgi:Pyruvate/2-oxoacid:ferredoxin oxidoreductase delta subunit